MNAFTEFLAAAGGVLIFDEIKKRLLDKLFYSLPEEEQSRIIIEVIKEMNSQDNQKEQAKDAIEDIYSLLKTTKGKTMIYAIDFDGTIVENAFPEIGKLKEEAARFIRSLKARGDKWILITMREGKYLDDAVEWLKAHGLTPDAVNDNLPECASFTKTIPARSLPMFT